MPLLGTFDDITFYPRLVHSKAIYYGVKLHAHNTARLVDTSQETLYVFKLSIASAK